MLSQVRAMHIMGGGLGKSSTVEQLTHRGLSEDQASLIYSGYMGGDLLIITFLTKKLLKRELGVMGFLTFVKHGGEKRPSLTATTE